ncbi:MAG: hypothetical protein ACM3TN_25340 [Alphaproteobacteria bacterium]
MWDLVKVLLTVVSVVLLLLVLGLGFLIPSGRVDPNFHGILAFLTGVLAIGIHIRIGSGLDFLALVLLIAAVGVGMTLPDASESSALHLWVAVFAVMTSVIAQMRNLFGKAK